MIRLTVEFKGKKKCIKIDKTVKNTIPIKPISESLKTLLFKLKIYFKHNNPDDTDNDIKKIKEKNISIIKNNLFMLNYSIIFYFYNLITIF